MTCFEICAQMLPKKYQSSYRNLNGKNNVQKCVYGFLLPASFLLGAIYAIY